MSQENVETFRRFVDAYNRRDVSAMLAIGHICTRGKGSGAETDSVFCSVTDFKNGKPILVRTFLDPQEALEAAGLRK